ncbi:MAG TPA: rod shape-determining protein MreD [Syntrophorhabdaceae bacterium]|nr:rod shape-determining protein MreD [Syntrophorhabdaceae bacterium]
MRVLIYIVICLACMVFESSISSRLPIDVFKPDFAVPLIIYVTFFMGPGYGFIAAMCSGIAGEVLSSAPTGAILFINMSIFLIMAFVKKQLYIDSKYSFAAICGGAVIIESFLFLVLSVLGKGETGNVLNIFFYAVPDAIFTGFVSVFIYSLLEHLNAAYSNRE